MSVAVAAPAKGDEVSLGIGTQLRARAKMVDFQMLPAAAPLATPAVSFQDLPAKLSMRLKGEA